MPGRQEAGGLAPSQKPATADAALMSSLGGLFQLIYGSATHCKDRLQPQLSTNWLTGWPAGWRQPPAAADVPSAPLSEASPICPAN